MDYRLNNEGLIACLIAQVVFRNKTKINNLAQISLMIALLLNDKTRKKLGLYARLIDLNDLTDSMSNVTLNILYKELLPVIVNSTVLLMQSGILSLDACSLHLTEKGVAFCNDMNNDFMGQRYQKIIQQVDHVITLHENFSLYELYNKFQIKI